MHQPPSHLQAAQQHSDEYDAHVSHVSTGPPPSGYHSMVQEHLLDPSISPGMQANSPVTYLQDPNTPFTAQSSRHAQPSSSTAHPFYGPSASSTGQQQQQQPYESSGSTSALGVVLSSPEPPAPPRIILHRAINEAEQLRKRMMRADEASQPSRTKRPRALSDLVPAQHNVGGGSSRHSPSDRNLAETRDEVSIHFDFVLFFASCMALVTRLTIILTRFDHDSYHVKISSYCDELCLLAERSGETPLCLAKRMSPTHRCIFFSTL